MAPQRTTSSVRRPISGVEGVEPAAVGVTVPVRLPARRSGVPTPPPSVRVRGRELGDASTDTKIREDMVAWGRLWGRL